MVNTSFTQSNPIAIFFIKFFYISIAATFWAAKQAKNTADFDTANDNISGWQNGFTLAGDFMSVASFLGIARLVALNDFNASIYSLGFLVGWLVFVFLIAEPLWNLGKYTFADVVADRMRQTPVTIAAAIGTLAVALFYLIAQIVVAGNLLGLLFGIDYNLALTAGGVMLAYIIFGGAIATAWMQVISALSSEPSAIEKFNEVEHRIHIEVLSDRTGQSLRATARPC